MHDIVPTLVALVSLALAGPASAEPVEDTSAKLRALDARVDQLARRVEVLEAGAAAGMASGPADRTGKDLAWHFDPYVGESPFQVSQQELDRNTGRVDLLLSLIAVPADGDLWRSAAVGAALPVAVTATLSGGEAVGPVAFTLARRAGFEPGRQVHLSAQLPVTDAKAVRRLVIRHTTAP